MKINDITETIIGAAMEVHPTIGPGLLESAYIQCLCYELALRKVPFVLELPLPVRYKGVNLDCGYRLDLVVADAVVVDVKAVERIIPLHEAQLLTYLRSGPPYRGPRSLLAEAGDQATLREAMAPHPQ